ncbi:hypothetical protein EJ02DRAFT_459702 [Clathrospora elynae]|uniref:Uncharacterized protein n=1 Tax=Clathrospora elynae TaxID=706981 RepID=A0A6A5S6L0_9PLEO|nr:hypothetical protein EJ02DRAFT_459702 [Clathrospora elynae]
MRALYSTQAWRISSNLRTLHASKITCLTCDPQPSPPQHTPQVAAHDIMLMLSQPVNHRIR